MAFSESDDKRYGRIRQEETGKPRPDLPQVGTIKVGEKRKNASGVEFPVSLDYFKADGDYAKKFEDAFGATPNTIEIVFISDDIEKSCLEEWEGRDKAGRKAGYGDGKRYWLFDDENLDYRQIEGTDAEVREIIKKVSKEKTIKWSVVLTLYFVIPKIPGIMGVWRFKTKGVKSSIENVRHTFDYIQSIYNTVIGIPFDLKVKKVKSDKPGSANLYPVVSIVPNLSEENLRLVARMVEQGQDIRKFGVLRPEMLKLGNGSDKELSSSDDIQDWERP